MIMIVKMSEMTLEIKIMIMRTMIPTIVIKTNREMKLIMIMRTLAMKTMRMIRMTL